MITQEAFNGRCYRAQTVTLTAGISAGLALRYRVIIVLGTATSCTLPDATQMPLGIPVVIVINQTGHNLTMKDATGTTVCVMSNNESAEYGLYKNDTAAGKWAPIQRFNSGSNFHRGSRAALSLITPSTPASLTCVEARYIVTDCNNVVPAHYTNSDFSKYVGLVVFLNEYPGISWQVAEFNGVIPVGSTLEALSISSTTGKKTISVRTPHGITTVVQIVTDLDVFADCPTALAASAPGTCPDWSSPFMPKRLFVVNYRDLILNWPPGSGGWNNPPFAPPVGFTEWDGYLYLHRSAHLYGVNQAFDGTINWEFFPGETPSISCQNSFSPPGGGTIAAWVFGIAGLTVGAVWGGYKPVKGISAAGVYSPSPQSGPFNINNGSFPYSPTSLQIVER